MADTKLVYDRPGADRIQEIREALEETPYQDRDPPDTAIGELLAEIDALNAELLKLKEGSTSW